ncbi:MAG: hypothetical protein HDT15_12090 [Oscillibacter sp.]|nr:hypothetical protein [Oscillibacter sp.]
MSAETFVCSICGEEHPVDECFLFDDSELCQDCYESRTCTCDHCGDRIWNDDACGDETHTLCRTCEERYYGHCSSCGRLVDLDDLEYLSESDCEGYCEDRYNRLVRERGIHSYCYKPEPIFYGDGSRFLGVELEIDDGGESNDNAAQIQNVGNRKHDHIYIKHDGSLEDGMEIVTHPMTLEYHRQEMPWQEVLQKAVSMGYLSHQCGTCGLHVHVNRSSLGDTYAEQVSTPIPPEKNLRHHQTR